jgi:formate-dependent nitrite reductase membrane component NrfD
MDLTESELKALRKLQKTERQFQKMKWGFVSLSLLMFIFCCYMAYILASIPEKTEGRIELQALAYSQILPMLFFFTVMTGFLIGTTIKIWIGDPNRTLLIGLAERLETESEPVR